MKKRLKIIYLIIVGIICFVGLVCCKKTGPIPNGYYCWSNEGENIYKFTDSDIRTTFGWEIKGNTAQRWTSGSVDYKAKIKERDNKIYFEGYKWKDLFSTVQSGTETIYEVIYNNSETKIIFILVE